MTNKKPIHEIVKDSSWQKVRQSLIGKWKSNPIQCCQELRGYLGTPTKASNDELRIVMNYLVGTAFRTGRIKHSCISSLRDQISKEMGERKRQGRWI